MRKPFNVITEEVKLEMYEAYGEVSDRMVRSDRIC